MNTFDCQFFDLIRNYWIDLTKFYDGDDVNVITAEFLISKTKPTSFYKKHIYKKQWQQMQIKFWKQNVENRSVGSIDSSTRVSL